MGRFWQIDALAEQANQVDKSPFAFAWNNPVRFNDPLGLSPLDDYLFDQSGNFIGVNQTNEPDRVVIINSSDCSVQCTAEFNDVPNDTKFIGGELVDDQFFDGKLVTVSPSDIENVMNNNGSRSTDESPLTYIERESRPSGDESVLSGKSEGKLDHVNNSDYIPSTASLYHVEGSGKVYNAKDFGNFLWGKSGKELGFSLRTLRGAAHLNNAVNGKSDNNNPNIPLLDSKTDQQAIKDGHKY